MSSTRWKGVLEDVRRARTRRGRAGLGAFVIEGPRLVSRALASGVEIVRVLFDAELPAARWPAQLLPLLSGPLAVPAPGGGLVEYSEGRESGRLLALVGLPAAFAEPPTLQRAAARWSSALKASPVSLVAVDVEEPGNVGALVRTAHACGGTLVCVGVTDPHHPKAVRTSLGSVLRAPLVRVETHAQLRQVMNELGVRAFAAVASGGKPPSVAAFGGGAIALLVGSEASGLPTSLRSHCEAVSIPMPGGADSFSVNAAAAILLYEALRQRGAQQVTAASDVTGGARE